MVWIVIAFAVALVILFIEVFNHRRRMDDVAVEMDIQRDTVDDMAQVAGQVHERMGLPYAWDDRVIEER